MAAGGSVVSEGGSSVGAAREGCGSLRGCWGVTTIGFSGSGHIGSQLARLAVAQGYDVVMSNSGARHRLRRWPPSSAPRMGRDPG